MPIQDDDYGALRRPPLALVTRAEVDQIKRDVAALRALVERLAQLAGLSFD